MTGAWGYGIFQSDRDLDAVADLDHDAGLDKLEKALRARIKAKTLTPEKHERYVVKAMEPYFTICKHCSTIDSTNEFPLTFSPVGGGSAPDEIRDHLDSGVLAKLFAEKEKELIDPPKHAWVPGYAFIILGACAMTLGCKIPPQYRAQVQKYFLHIGMMECAERQIFKALNGPEGYEEGVPYEFVEPEDVTAAHEAEMAERERNTGPGGFVMMNVPSPHGVFAGPPKNQALRTTMVSQRRSLSSARIPPSCPMTWLIFVLDLQDEGKFGPSLCGGCGADKTDDGETLLRCGKCKKREYCSVGCQKEHWKFHKYVCKAAEGGKKNSGP